MHRVLSEDYHLASLPQHSKHRLINRVKEHCVQLMEGRHHPHQQNRSRGQMPPDFFIGPPDVVEPLPPLIEFTPEQLHRSIQINTWIHRVLSEDYHLASLPQHSQHRLINRVKEYCVQIMEGLNQNHHHQQNQRPPERE
ncbi:hypothetical protein QBC32DRAFT_339377 [Pseudoneurospora amorphoporcata]|uniref:Uncharacterized protein n=1 Tax=Pseudoneurospora amorphoporcata TaxID=241081 RepID=A0AAN6NW75_9PEZI|nr:hypothetical protein QBC32DRAFT_339377 [Pseudoneurospora amorphoporcata]